MLEVLASLGSSLLSGVGDGDLYCVKASLDMLDPVLIRNDPIIIPCHEHQIDGQP